MTETREEARKAVKPEKINPKFKYELMNRAGCEKITLCFQCGTCTADCAIARFTDLYRPRKVARMVQLGLKDRLLSNDALWLCTTCFTCVDHCPQGVEVSSIVRALRNMSVKERNEMPFVFKAFASNIVKTGYVYVMPESRHKRREEEGLPPLPKPNIEHVTRIFDATGFLGAFEGIRTFEKVNARRGNQNG